MVVHVPWILMDFEVDGMIDKGTEEIETCCLESKIEFGSLGMYTESPRSPAERFQIKSKNR